MDSELSENFTKLTLYSKNCGYLSTSTISENMDIDMDVNNEFEKYKILAEQGDVKAQFNLALCYEDGYGTEENPNEAFKWYKISAEQKNPNAQYELAQCYQNGYGTESNQIEAFKWYKVSAEQGIPRAQFNLALCYEHGTGTEENLKESLRWFRNYIRTQKTPLIYH